MKLNSLLVFDNLSEAIKAEIYNPSIKGLNLMRPQFYSENKNTFQSNHLYIVKSDQLPLKPNIEKDAVIICIGDNIQLDYYKESCCVIKVDSSANLLAVFNCVQDIFNKYDAWGEKLTEILNKNANISDMIECSKHIFNNPMFVIDANFHFIAHTGYEDIKPTDPNGDYQYPYDNDSLRLHVLGQFLELHELAMHIKEPQLINLKGSSTLDINLFQNDEYIGCLTIDYLNREHRTSDIAIGKFLSDMITLAFQKYSAVLSDEKSVLRRILQDIIMGLPEDINQHRIVDSMNDSKEYVCVKMQFNNRFSQLPIGYVCNLIENNFPKSIALEMESAIIGFIPKEDTHGIVGVQKKKFDDVFMNYIQFMDMKMGISDSFTDLYDARFYYKQACSALDNGSLMHLSERYYSFQDYALIEMIINSLGDLTAEMYFSEGLKRLAEHDKNSQVSYMDTLHTYLEQNMSITKTASILYIHRSTLLDRLTRIEKELNTNLQDPDERLKILILLKALQIHKNIQGVTEE